MDILVPLAGKDESFIEEFGDMKPFVKVKGRCLIEIALGCLPFKLDRLIFVCLKEHDRRFNAVARLRRLFGSGTRVVLAERPTEGAACSALLAEEYIMDGDDLLIDLADILFDPFELESCLDVPGQQADGVIPVSTGAVQRRPWGYVYYSDNGLVSELREKEISPLSDAATLGLYYFRRGADFVTYTKRMIEENSRISYNNLFYIGPVYNYLVRDGLKITTCETVLRRVLGTVDDIRMFIEEK